jgi:hypothetical protein
MILSFKLFAYFVVPEIIARTPSAANTLLEELMVEMAYLFILAGPVL